MTRRQAGLVVTVVHAALMGSLGLKLLADRARLPRGWALTAPYDPSTPLRGRYVRLSLEIPLASALLRLGRLPALGRAAPVGGREGGGRAG